MNYPIKILFKLLVKPFYRENAGALLFFVTMLFCIVAPVHGAGLVEYHVSLINGLLHSDSMLGAVFFLWFLYARKCAAFVRDTLVLPDVGFIYIYNSLSREVRFGLFFLMNICLLLPILIYFVFIVIVAIHQHATIRLAMIIAYILLLCIVPAIWQVYLLSNRERKIKTATIKLQWLIQLLALYPVVLLRSIYHRQKLIFLGVKFYSCFILYGIARNNTATQYEMASVFYLFNFGVLANGILVLKTREFEDKYLLWYRGAAVPLMARLLEYAGVYLVLLMPEIITALYLVPVHLHVADAVMLMISSYSLILLLNSVTYFYSFSMKGYLKIAMVIVVIQFLFFTFLSLTPLYITFFLVAPGLFLISYYRYEKVLR